MRLDHGIWSSTPLEVFDWSWTLIIHPALMKQMLKGHHRHRAPPPSQSLQTPLNPSNYPTVPTFSFPSRLLGFSIFLISILTILIEGSGGPGHTNNAAIQSARRSLQHGTNSSWGVNLFERPKFLFIVINYTLLSYICLWDSIMGSDHQHSNSRKWTAIYSRTIASCNC